MYYVRFKVVGDEFHFILQCIKYVKLRRKCIKEYYWFRPLASKLVQLLSVEITKEFCNLGRFILMVFKIRNNTI
jgi:hypothetical protein